MKFCAKWDMQRIADQAATVSQNHYKRGIQHESKRNSKKQVLDFIR